MGKRFVFVFFLLCSSLAQPFVCGECGDVLDLPFDPFSSLSTFSNLFSNFGFLIS